jgi:hypothetical protein
MTEPLPVRIGTPADLDQLMALASEACEENGFIPPNPYKVLEQIWAAVNQDRGLCGIIGEIGAPIEAAVLLRITDLFYSDQPVLEEKGIFVNSAFRAAKGGRARRLCEFSKEIADHLGIPLLIGVLSNHRTEAKVRLYRRQFGEPAGAFFLYGAVTGITASPEMVGSGRQVGNNN